MWQRLAGDYKELIASPDWDSRYLRELGLIPNIVSLAGDCGDSVLLDAGTGTGWLFDHVKPRQAYACDIVTPKHFPEGVTFTEQNVDRLGYPDDIFDVIVASLLLIYCEDIEATCRELFRVAKPGGARLVISIMEPFFYRTGVVADDGKFVVSEDLSKPFSLQLRIAEKVGPFIYYYRPLTDYINALISAGWLIESTHNWFIDMDEYRRATRGSADSKVGRSGRVPMFTFIACRTP